MKAARLRRLPRKFQRKVALVRKGVTDEITDESCIFRQHQAKRQAKQTFFPNLHTDFCGGR